MYLEEIINDIKLENDKYESKAILNREDVVGWLKSIVGFVNATGGDFYIGVEEKQTNQLGLIEKKQIIKETTLTTKPTNI